MQYYGVKQIKNKLQLCWDIFCEEGTEGVCIYAMKLSRLCEEDFGFPVGELLDFCGTYDIYIYIYIYM